MSSRDFRVVGKSVPKIDALAMACGREPYVADFDVSDSVMVVDGPFAETKELIAGFWLWEVRSMEEAIEWVKRCPNPMVGESEIEIRQVFEAEDFGEEFTPELREQEERIRSQVAAKKA